ncbi:glycosyltransferase [uncultured Duncaniella sp.]|uniref:glycosyltransferase n=1 Tax=uncultured Duncaniella sp. TaxID=2768039 RepID=UPI0025B5E672|nr:glycosyltransferase [uncultured Duncaniella sp.]
MKVIHSGSCNVLAGGPALSTWLTIKGVRDLGVEAELLMEPIKEGKIISENLNPTFSENSKYGSLAYVPALNKTLDSMGEADIYHVQGVWMLHGTQVARYAKKHNKPYIVTLRGMLYPQALAHKSAIKKVSLRLYQAQTLRMAAAIQCTCKEEMDHYRALGFRNPVAIIPNPIEVDKYIDKPILKKSTFRIGYLGRIHPRKRVERLIYAMDSLKSILSDNAELLIIGGGDKEYENFLHKEVGRLNLVDKVRFTGFLSGDDKDKAIESLSVLAVPSDFENFGNIVTEALVHGVPVIASKGMPWQELTENGCGWWIDNSQDTIDKTILEAYNLGAETLYKMGVRGRELMLLNYSVEALGQKMKTLYEWILNGGNKPNFVFTVDGK